MVEEAGGEFTDFNGQKSFDYSGRKTNNYVVSNGRYHQYGLEIANPVIPGR